MLFCSGGSRNSLYPLHRFPGRHKRLIENQKRFYKNGPPVWHCLHKILRNRFHVKEENHSLQPGYFEVLNWSLFPSLKHFKRK